MTKKEDRPDVCPDGLLSNSGIGIRTPTYRVRVCCATVTQYRCILSAMSLADGVYYITAVSVCQPFFEIFFEK